jgi:hypothetical protein
MGILNLLDTEYIDEFEYEGSYAIDCSRPEEEKTYIPKPNDRYTYRSMLEVLFPD